MNIQELKLKSSEQLIAQAEELGIENASTLRKQEIKLEQQIEKFRVREIKELEKLEKICLKEQREDYAGLQERIDK